VRPMPGRPERWFVTFALACVVLGMVVAGYLYSSAVPIENDCFLAGEKTCAGALWRAWAALATVGISVVLGVMAAIGAARGKRANHDR
jgi:hypothetical protein